MGVGPDLWRSLDDWGGFLRLHAVGGHDQSAAGMGIPAHRHGLLPRVHGSSLFTRGETQSLATVTLGTIRDAQIIDGLQDEYGQNFMLHYNFPPFSVGEVKPVKALAA
jgi:hypothetical protein